MINKTYQNVKFFAALRKVSIMFYKMHSSIAELDINNSDKLVLSYVINNAQVKGYCWSKNETIGIRCGISKSTVKLALKRLAVDSYIEIVPQNIKGFSKTNHIYPLPKTLLLTNEKAGGLTKVLARERRIKEKAYDLEKSHTRQLIIAKSALAKSGLPYQEYDSIILHLNAYLPKKQGGSK